jgi:hypothetical protein
MNAGYGLRVAGYEAAESNTSKIFDAPDGLAGRSLTSPTTANRRFAVVATTQTNLAAWRFSVFVA